MENLKSIPDYEGLYSADDKGNIYSHNFNGTGELKKLKLYNHPKGYICATLYKDKIATVHLAHRLIIKAFKPNPQNKKEVKHNDKNRINNNVYNLDWATRSENIKHYKVVWYG